jgi:hypothetical protein
MTSPVYARGVMLLLFDIGADAIAEHDRWHTHEHMPERLRLPGFLRGTRWTTRDTIAHYCVLYEVASIAVLDSAAYRERLDHPTPWTAAMMRKYSGMRRALCTVEASSGCGMGSSALVVRFASAEGRQGDIDRWLTDEVLPGLAQRPGFAGCHLFQNALAAAMTQEQEIRGRDGTLHSALFVTGYDEAAVAALAQDELAPERFVAHGAAATESGSRLYRQSYALSATDLRATS